MTRAPRASIPGMPQHLVVRGNNRLPCFVDDRDRNVYLGYLQEYSIAYTCEIHAYVLMTNHVHLLATGRAAPGVSLFMQVLNRRYCRYFNKAHERTGTLYEGRFRSSPIETERYFFAVMRYIELNPVRAGMVTTPDEYRWSSYRENVRGAPRGLVTPHPLYNQLGTDPGERSRAYRRLFESTEVEETTTTIRECVFNGSPLK